MSAPCFPLSNGHKWLITNIEKIILDLLAKGREKTDIEKNQVSFIKKSRSSSPHKK